VGHNPGMHEAARLLIASGDVEQRERLNEGLPTSGLAVIDFAGQDWRKLHAHGGRLERFVTPRSLAAADRVYRVKARRRSKPPPSPSPAKRVEDARKRADAGGGKGGGYPRDLVGYGKRLPDPKWPGQARLALQISLNYECGGELNVLHGDAGSESMLTDIGFPAVKGARSRLVESSFEYGSRRGGWRLVRPL